jgi:hypothetical protein
MILGMDPAEFLSWKGNESVEELNGVSQPLKQHFKKARQLAKPINFGVPGGMAPRSLVGYARSVYGVVMTLEEAERFHQKLTREVYPELANYLEDDGMAVLARRLGVSEEACWGALTWGGGRHPATVKAVRKVVEGRPFKADGTPYDGRYVRRVWGALNALCRDDDLRARLSGSRGSPGLAGQLFDTGSTTLTGRVRGGVSFTEERNAPFQGLASDGAKLAFGRLARRGRRVVGFIHDEILEELPDQGGYVSLEQVEESVSEIRRAMEEVTGGIPVSCEYTLSTCWSKRAELIVRDGKVFPWSPGT